MDVTARTDRGELISVGKREYREVGLDLDGNERLGAWQIKEIIDLSLFPGKKTEERFVAELPDYTKTAEIEVSLKYYLSPSYESLVYRRTRQLSFEK